MLELITVLPMVENAMMIPGLLFAIVILGLAGLAVLTLRRM